MVNVKNNRITMTRGDTCRIKISLADDAGGEYIPKEGDEIRFAAKKTYSDPEPLIFKTVPHDTMTLEIAPEDTKPLEFGTYVYDIQITFADGTVNTFVTKAQLKIEEEVD